MKFEKDSELYGRALQAWTSLDTFRHRRRRLKRFTYGRQWEDTIVFPDGEVISEENALLREGHLPITNNLLRRMVKTLTGRFRRENPDITAVDARALEEFLISGSIVQRIGSSPAAGGGEVVNFSQERLFFEPFSSPDASDCCFFGLLHDMPLRSLICCFSEGSYERALALRKLWADTCCSAGSLTGPSVEASSFAIAAAPRSLRVIEVWRRTLTALLRVHDPESGSVFLIPFTSRVSALISHENSRRKAGGRKELKVVPDIESGWENAWLGPGGEVLARIRKPENAVAPIVMRFYPMVDGEIHSAVEDVVPQQKLVNRLVTLIDEVIASSAKGIVLYPSDQLPEGITWDELRRMWSSPGSIVPFKRTSKTIMPREVMGNPSVAGAAQLLQTQLRLFEEISGVTSPEATSERMSAEAMRQQEEARSVATVDLFADFREFISARDAALAALSNKTQHVKST